MSTNDLGVRLQNAQRRIAEARQTLATAQGQINAHLQILQKDFGVKTYEEGLALEERLNGEIVALETELGTKLQEFENAFSAKPAVR